MRVDNHARRTTGLAMMPLNRTGRAYLHVIVRALLVVLAPMASLSAQAQQVAATRTVSSIEHTVKILPAQQSTPTPFKNFKGVILLRVKINGQDAWAMLDNGFSHTVVDLAFAKAARLGVGPVITTMNVGPVSLPERLVESATIDVPGQLVLSGQILAVSLSSFSKTIGHPIDVVIGGDYTDKMAVLVASSNNTLIFAKTGDLKPKGRSAIIPLEQGNRLAAEVNSKPVNLAIDLGFNGVVQLTREMWDRVIPTGSSTNDGMISSADGVLRPSRSVTNATLKVGKISADGVGVAVGDRIATGADGLLGTGFLTKFDFILDVAARQLIAIPFG